MPPHPAYCNPEDVMGEFRKDITLGEQSEPPKSEVEDRIEAQSRYIDRRTNHGWGGKQIEEEYHDYDGSYQWDVGRPVMLNHRNPVTPLDSAQGDKLELWSGNDWEDWVADDDHEEGRDEDYWFDERNGELWIFSWFQWGAKPRVRITYRIEEDVPADISRACAKLVAAGLIRGDVYSQLIPGNDDGVGPREMADQKEGKAEDILEERKEIARVGPW